MTSPTRLPAVLELLEGRSSLDEVAARHGLAPGELEQARELFVAGLRSAGPSRRALNPWRRRFAVMGLAGVLVTGAAWAQLTPFVGGQPALASQVNGNFTQLQQWLEQKVGTAGQATVRIASADAVTATSGSGAVVIGDPSADNLALDPNDVQARVGATTGSLGLNANGGFVTIGNSASTVLIRGSLARTSLGSSGALLAGPLPKQATITTRGGRVLLFIGGSAYLSAGTGVMGLDVAVDGTAVGGLDTYTNEAGSHKAFVSRMLPVTLFAGTHTVSLTARGSTLSDVNDRFEVSFIELPAAP